MVRILFSIALLICVSAIWLTPEASALGALDKWDDAARLALPVHIKVWLGAMLLTNIATIGFLKNHIAARWVFAGFVVSHGIVMAMWAMDTSVLAGQVSLFHIVFWTPGAFMLLRHRRDIQYPSAYAIWATLSLIFYAGSMFIDVQDASIFVQYFFLG